MHTIVYAHRDAHTFTRLFIEYTQVLTEHVSSTQFLFGVAYTTATDPTAISHIELPIYTVTAHDTVS